MSEAQPTRKVGGHAYGRRTQQLSNTAEEGELCIYTGHSLGRFSSHSMRFDSHQACVRCVAAAREGRGRDARRHDGAARGPADREVRPHGVARQAAGVVRQHPVVPGAAVMLAIALISFV